MTTYELAHRFFYEPEARGEYTRVNTSFTYFKYADGTESRRYYSYNTCIAEIKRDKHGELCLIISDDTYSKTTSKHLYELRRACPYNASHVINVPRVSAGFYYEGLDGTYDFCRKLSAIKAMTEKDLRLKDERWYVMHNLDLYDTYVAHFDDMDKKSKRLRKSVKLKRVVDMVIQKDMELEARRERLLNLSDEEKAQRKAKREAAAKRKLDKFLNEGDTLDKIKEVFSRRFGYRYNQSDLTKAMHEYKNLLHYQRDEQGRYLSYVWLDGDMVRTSQYCKAPVEDAKRLCAMWKRHQSMLGEHAGMYTVVENDANHVKIGCHVIPAWNIELLCNKLNITA